MPNFISGLQLSELFYKEVVKHILESEFPELKYSVGLIGSGSEVLGFDTPQSTDHCWGPRLLLFLCETDYRKNREKISNVLSERLPYKFRGYSTNFSEPDNEGDQWLEEIEDGPVNHKIEIFSLKSFFKQYLDIDTDDEMNALDWLTFSEQKLRTIKSGKIFHDDLGLNRIRKRFDYYPKDVWLYLLASQWRRISQEEAFVGRCGDVGDELGSKIIAARLVGDVMRLCFLIEKEYAPYSKWFGTAFSRLKCAKKLTPLFNKVLSAQNWKIREKHLSSAYEEIAKMHNKLDITKPLPTKVSRFHSRPYLIIHGDLFVTEIKKKIKSRAIKNIKVNIGSVNQFSDSTDVRCNTKLTRKLKILYK